MTAAGTTGFALRVPESWFEFDIWRATRTGDLARMLDARIAQAPELAQHRKPLLRLMREAAEEAERRGARYCAVSGDLTDDGDQLAAALVVLQTDGTGDPDLDRPEAIAAQITATAPSAGSPLWRQVEVVEIPAGTAVRTYGVDSAGERSQAVVMQTLIPVPGRPVILNVVLTSPQTVLAEPLLDLFDAISGTLTWA
ncbi:hypothetical protein [Actinoplanes sp. NPDC049265]|uniref:hypothetical protein n=1 Tax=Actinoplanes sp. NPDC049265 TaxID=3363902 RepID=UPI00372077AF